MLIRHASIKTHKIRICEEEEIETQFRLGLLSGLLLVVALAAYSTFKLHKIADYQVFEIKMISSRMYLPSYSLGTL